METLSGFFAALLVSLAATRLLIVPAIARRLLDHPNERSLHQHPKPRTGGLAILAAAAAGGVLVWSRLHPEPHLPLLAGALLVAAISLCDDFGHVPARYRLLVQFAASLPAALAFPLTFPWVPGVVAAPLSLLFAVWMINLYNFMDGMDGFAGGMGVCGFACLGALGGGDPLFAALALTLAGANLGFLFFNFPPSRLFMGDAGSATMGFAAAVFSLWGIHDGLFSLWAALLVFSPFVVDATVTLIRRILRRERFWEAHRGHYYQRLVTLGWGHRKTVLVEYGFMILAGATALLLENAPSFGLASALIAGWIVAYALFFRMIARMETAR